MSEPEIDLEAMDNSQLEALLAGLPPPGSPPPQEAVPEEEPPAPVEDAPVAPAVEEPPAEPAEPEVDPIQDFRQQWDAERRALEAKIELQMAHNSRLAGELGFLKNQPPPRPEPDRPDAFDGQPDPRADEALSRLDKLEADVRNRNRWDGINQEIAVVRQLDLDAIKDDLPIAAQKFQSDIQILQDTVDPEAARLMTRRVLNAVIAEAERMKDGRDRQARIEKRAATVTDMAKVKKIGTISASGGTPAPPSKAKATSEMSVKELDSLLKEMTGS